MRRSRHEASRPRGIRAFRIPAASALFLAVLSHPCASSADEAQDLKAAIVMRCYNAVGEFGAELVDRCVKEDAAAEQALRQYPREHASIVHSCSDRLLGDGFGRVKACVDEQIAAKKAPPDPAK